MLLIYKYEIPAFGAINEASLINHRVHPRHPARSLSSSEIHTFTYIYIHTYIYTYIHTYIHTYWVVGSTFAGFFSCACFLLRTYLHLSSTAGLLFLNFTITTSLVLLVGFYCMVVLYGFSGFWKVASWWLGLRS